MKPPEMSLVSTLFLSHGEAPGYTNEQIAEALVWCQDHPEDIFFEEYESQDGPSRADGASFREIMDREYPDVRWADPGVVPEGLTILASVPKWGKSWFCMAMAAGYSVNTGEQHPDPESLGDVLYLALEDNPRRLKTRLLALEDAGVRIPGNIYTYTAGEWPRMGSGFEEKLAAWLVAHPSARLVIVDTLAKVRPSSDKMSYQMDADALSGLHAVANSGNLAILVVTHTRKQSRSERGFIVQGDPVEEVTGTLGLAGTADTILVGQGDRSNGKLTGRGRDLEEDVELSIIRPGVLWQKVSSEAPEDGALRYLVLETLRGAESPGLGLNELFRGCCPGSKNKLPLMELLEALVQEGLVARDPAAKGKTRHHRLAETQPVAGTLEA